jgi:hypothetical protein
MSHSHYMDGGVAVTARFNTGRYRALVSRASVVLGI